MLQSRRISFAAVAAQQKWEFRAVLLEVFPLHSINYTHLFILTYKWGPVWSQRGLWYQAPGHFDM